ncbi:LacI family DNA-binding transcriptional regulator [Halarsenatibacter silvermanii]|uniref:Transcriptional regulator, LacI family n=1 Tax=Halarsenatibacter silvermanii TaxID=321763 RepID=A0A1G9S3A3_9FIRM|nr:LacI family DNA-binding transcriptional regulator [Halarsenatibacter silvermanii]SDM29902.1 transcriptional regulator, LacI family [Halarsenatibacter silvermanii]
MTEGNNITIKDIAEKSGVSVTTVSRVLNDKPDVKDATRAKVLKVIKESNYRPNGMARSLVINQTYSIGLIIPDINNPYFPEVARGVEDQAQDSSYSVIFSSTDNKLKREKEVIDLMLQKSVDGLIVSLSLANKDILKRLEDKKIPVVQLDRKIPDSRYPAVMVDNKKSAYKAVQFLIDEGYKRIAHITGDLQTVPGRERKNGYRKAILANNFSFNQDMIFEGDFSKRAGYDALKKITEKGSLPEAIFAANDMMAIGVLEACRQKGIKVPEDIVLVGHDNISISNLVYPALTTMAQPKYKLGRKASELLIELIEIKQEKGSLDRDNLFNDQILETQLVKRGSTSRV